MFGTIGGPELFLILVIALIVFGPRKLPEIGKGLGKMMVEFRRASNDFRRTVEDEVEAEKRRPAAAPALPNAPAAAPMPAPPPQGTIPAGTEAPAPGADAGAGRTAPEAEPVGAAKDDPPRSS